MYFISFQIFASTVVHNVYKQNLIAQVKYAHYKGQALLLSHLIGWAGTCMDKIEFGRIPI